MHRNANTPPYSNRVSYRSAKSAKRFPPPSVQRSCLPRGPANCGRRPGSRRRRIHDHSFPHARNRIEWRGLDLTPGCDPSRNAGIIQAAALKSSKRSASRSRSGQSAGRCGRCNRPPCRRFSEPRMAASRPFCIDLPAPLSESPSISKKPIGLFFDLSQDNPSPTACTNRSTSSRVWARLRPAASRLEGGR